jgi:hypothetical protein
MKLSFRMTQSTSVDINEIAYSKIFGTVYPIHKQDRPSGGNEWFLVLKPTDTNTVIEDGDHNQLAVVDVKILRKMYSVHDKMEDEEVVTLLYPEEY